MKDWLIKNKTGIESLHIIITTFMTCHYMYLIYLIAVGELK